MSVLIRSGILIIIFIFCIIFINLVERKWKYVSIIRIGNDRFSNITKHGKKLVHNNAYENKMIYKCCKIWYNKRRA
jgi:hypothetical protein